MDRTDRPPTDRADERRPASRTAAMNAPVIERLLNDAPQPEVDGTYSLRVLETRGRHSGLARRTPLGVLLLDGRRYLVSPNPTRAWVRNLEADAACALLGGGRRDDCRAMRAPTDEAIAAVQRYLDVVRAPWARSAFPFPAGAPDTVVREHIEGIAVFWLDERRGLRPRADDGAS